jgi:hypothetical protein
VADPDVTALQLDVTSPAEVAAADTIADDVPIVINNAEYRNVIIFCHCDPLLPPLVGATDITAAETRLNEMPGQGYLRLEYGAPIVILPKRS